MRHKIGILEDKFTASSWYRSYGPLSRLTKEYDNIDIIDLPVKEINYKTLLPLTTVLILRPNSPGQLELVKLCNRLSIRVWIDLDDNLFEIPINNPAYYAYRNTDILEQCLKKADIVTVSTAHLSKVIKDKTGVNSHVINNAIDEIRLDITPRDMNIVWRGSATHYADLEIYKDVFTKLSTKYTLHFMGVAPIWKINYMYHAGQNLFDFYESFKNLKPTFLLYPLEENNFNYSKSNIAFLEATQAGAVTMTNLHTTEWNWNSILHDPEIFEKESLEDIYTNYLENSVKIVNKYYNINDINQSRLNLLNN